MNRDRSKKSRRQIAWEKGYAFREYGVTEEEMERVEHNLERDYQKNKKAGKLIVLRTKADFDKLRKKLFCRNAMPSKFH